MKKLINFQTVLKEKISLIDARTNGRCYAVNIQDFVEALFFRSTNSLRSNKKFDIFKQKNMEVNRTEDGWFEIRIKGLGSIFFPSPFSESESVGVLREIFRILIDTSSDHYYEKRGTMVEPKDVVADCGAAEGSFTLSVCKRCKEVYAIEPNRFFIKSMQRTFANISNVKIIQTGLSNKKGTAQLMDRGCGSQICDGKADYDVDLIPLDDIFYLNSEPLDYLKADLEGYEIKMLEGARKTIKEFGPKISITTYHVPTHSSQIRDLLWDLNPDYKMYTTGIRWRSISGSVECWPSMLHAWIEK